MANTETATKWEAESAYIGDDVYQGMDIVTDIPDIDGNPLIVYVQNGSKVQDEQVARRIVKAVNHHDELVEALREVVRISDRKHEAWDRAKAILARVQESGE